MGVCCTCPTRTYKNIDSQWWFCGSHDLGACSRDFTPEIQNTMIWIRSILYNLQTWVEMSQIWSTNWKIYLTKLRDHKQWVKLDLRRKLFGVWSPESKFDKFSNSKLPRMKILYDKQKQIDVICHSMSLPVCISWSTFHKNFAILKDLRFLVPYCWSKNRGLTLYL